MKANHNMKNIDPVSNPADIKPENKEQPTTPTPDQSPQTNAASASVNNTVPQQSQPNPAVSAFQFPEDAATTPQQAVSDQPQAAAVNPQTPSNNLQQNTPTINPETSPVQPAGPSSTTPPTQTYTSMNSSLLTPPQSRRSISVMVVSIMTAVAAIYLVVVLLRQLLGTDDSSIVGSALLFSGANWAGWLLLIIYLLQLALAVFASYKLWKGSMAALAFISGMSFLYLYAVVYSTIVGLMFILQASSEYGLDIGVEPQTYIILVLSILYYGALVGCWTRGRKNLD